MKRVILSAAVVSCLLCLGSCQDPTHLPPEPKQTALPNHNGPPEPPNRSIPPQPDLNVRPPDPNPPTPSR